MLTIRLGPSVKRLPVTLVQFGTRAIAFGGPPGYVALAAIGPTAGLTNSPDAAPTYNTLPLFTFWKRPPYASAVTAPAWLLSWTAVTVSPRLQLSQTWYDVPITSRPGIPTSCGAVQSAV